MLYMLSLTVVRTAKLERLISGLGHTMKLSSIGIIVALFALTAALLSPWVIAALSPPAPPIEKEIIDFASKLKDAAIAKAKGVEYVPASNSEPNTPLLVEYYFPGVISLAMLGVCIGVIALVHEPKKLPGSLAVGFGLTAAIAQWSLFIAFMIIGLIFITKVLDIFGADLSLFDW